MNAHIYKLLNSDTKCWWYHAKLRAAGNNAEARKRERESIKRSLADIRSALATNGAYAIVGYGGCSLHHTKNGHISGISENSGFWKAIIASGIPMIDVRPCVDNGKWTASIPMIAVGEAPEQPPYHGCSYAPLDYVFNEYVSRGAIAHNWKE